MRKLWLVLSAVLVVVLCASACAPAPAQPSPPPTEATATPVSQETPEATVAEEAPRYGGTLRAAAVSDWGSLDNCCTWHGVYFQVMRQVSNSLMQLDRDGSIVPDAAEEVTVSDDGLVYTFTLHEMKFHNGREVTAEDWVYSLARHLDPNVGSWFGFLLDHVKGAGDYMAGEADSVEGLQAPDDHTLQITLSEPDAMLLAALTVPTLNVLPREAVEADPEGFATHPVYTGPFMVDEYALGTKLTLVRNPDYWEEGLPYLDAIEIDLAVDRAVGLLRTETGELDFHMEVIGGSGNIPPQELGRVLDDPQLQGWVDISTPSDVGLLILNASFAGLDDVKVRQAIANALDYDRLALLVHGEPANYVWNPTKFSYNPDYPGYSYDPEKARGLLEDAGYADGEGLPDEDWWMPVADTAPWPEVGETIQSNLAEIGIDVEIRVVPQSEVSAAWGDPTVPMLLDHQQDTVPDPAEFADCMLCAAFTPDGFNFTHVCNPQWDEWIATARSSTDIQERTTLYRQLGDAVMESASWIPLWYSNMYAIHSPKIGNFAINKGIAHTTSMKEWWLME